MEERRARVVFLGTGGANSVARSCAGLAVVLPSDDVLLLDTCGGNEVLRQLHAAGIGTGSIRAVVVTHQHFDHAAGLPPLVMHFARLGREVDLYCPREAVAPLRTVVDVLSPRAAQRARLRWNGCVSGDTATIQDGVQLTFVEVQHVVPCIGVVVDVGGRRLVYSGDTGPSEALVRAAAGATLLIHEGTGLAAGGDTERTRAAGHSLAADAGRAARDAGVQRLILTHVGDASLERCARLVEEAAAEFSGPLHVASDLEAITL